MGEETWWSMGRHWREGERRDREETERRQGRDLGGDRGEREKKEKEGTSARQRSDREVTQERDILPKSDLI